MKPRRPHDLAPWLWLALTAMMAPASGAELPPLDCVIKPYVVTDVGSPSEGVIETISVERNELIKAGQKLATLRSDVEKATVELARAKAQLTGTIESRRAALEFGRRKQARTDELFTKKAVPFHLKDEAETEAVLAETKLQEAEENKRLAELDLKRAIAALNLRTIQSPITGVVVERLMSPGEFVDDNAILRVAQLDPLKVEVIVPVEMFGSIKTGMRASVMPEVPGTGAYAASVSTVDRVVDGSSGTFGVRLELPNPDYRLPGGLRCSVNFLAETDAADPGRLGSGPDTHSGKRGDMAEFNGGQTKVARRSK